MKEVKSACVSVALVGIGTSGDRSREVAAIRC